MSAVVLINNQFELVVEELSISPTVEDYVWEGKMKLAPLNWDDERKKYLSYLTKDEIRRKAVISIYINGHLYFTGFANQIVIRQEKEKIIGIVELRSKTIDIQRSTYKPVSYSNKGISQFDLSGKTTYLGIIKQSLLSLNWVIVAPHGSDGLERLEKYNTISIIDKSNTAKAVIPLDKKTGETTENNVFVDEGDYFNEIKATKETLKPAATQSVGNFLNSIANELGKILTTNEFGDIVIDNLLEDETNISPIKTFLSLPDNDKNNIEYLEIGVNDEQVFYSTARIDANGKLSFGKTSERTTVDAGQVATGGGGAVTKNTNMILSVNETMRETAHLTYTQNETVNVKQQLANQEMIAKTQEARSNAFTVKPIAMYYEATAGNMNPVNGTPIRVGDVVFLKLYDAVNDIEYDNEMRVISSMDIQVDKDKVNVSITLKMPNFFANPSVKQRRVVKPRPLSQFKP